MMLSHNGGNMTSIQEHDETNGRGRNEQPVTSLLVKYSNMDRQFEQVRQEVNKVELEIQNRQKRINELLEERQEMKRIQGLTLEEQVRLTKEAENAMQELHQIEEETAQALAMKQDAQALLDRARQRSKDYRQQFLESSRVFRSQCKRFKLEGTISGLTNTNTRLLAAYAVVKKTQLVEVFHEPEMVDEEDDLEYTEAFKLLKELEESHQQSKRERAESQSKIDSLVARADRQTKERGNLKSQLARLQEDARKIKEQIQGLKSNANKRSKTTQSVPETSRANAISPVPNSNGIYNPYSKSCRGSSSVQASKNKRPRKDSRQTLPSSNVSASNRTSATQQYPHRVGRVRPSRNFGLSLGIENSDDDDDDDDDELLSYVAFRK